MIAWCVTTDAGRTVRCAASKDAACDKTYVGRVFRPGGRVLKGKL
jgi:hypothetical protein